MWAVARPPFQAGEAFNVCISRIRDRDLRSRLKSVEAAIVTAAEDYESKAVDRALNLVAASNSVDGIVTKDEMVKVYDQRMAGKNAPGRAIYDQIKLLPRGDRCPFCDQRNISTLDHILPKTLYPSLAVTPLNLVAACMECNKAKLSLAPQTQNDVILHPYFDDITSDRWLTANVVHENPCAIVFSVTRPEGWDNLTETRARAQFKLLGLRELYSSEAARELSNIRHNLQTHFDAGGVDAVRQELTRQWNSRKKNQLNSWQTALYEAIAHDNWFCNEGFSYA